METDSQIPAGLRRIEAALLAANLKVNLVSRKDSEALVSHHLLPCYAFTKFCNIPDNATVLDLGCGGGLPGLVLADTFPNAQFTLLDSVGKKINAVRNIAEEIGLNNVVTINARAENINQKFDIVVGRAVAALPKFINWAEPLLAKPKLESAGIYYWKGGPIEEEVAPLVAKQYFLCDLIADEEYYADKYILYIPTSKLKNGS